MWLAFDVGQDGEARFARSLGRALALGQSFEGIIRGVAWCVGIEVAAGGEVPVRDLYWKIGKRLQKDRLASVIEGISNEPELVSSEDALVLLAARKARNHIVHVAAAPLLEGKLKSRGCEWALDSLRTRVTDLSRGEHLVSKWEYWIEDKEHVGSPFEETDYVKLVARWVFSSE